VNLINNASISKKIEKTINDSGTNSKTIIESDPMEKSFQAPNIIEENQIIDYMAKDYESFRNLLLQLASKKFPDWHLKNEADIRMILIDLFSYVADELSYYQDRVANEAFLRTAKKRSSVSSLLNLIDYNLHNGCSAQTFLCVDVNEIGFIPKEFQISNKILPGHQKIVFETDRDYNLFPKQNKIKLYFDGEKKELSKGSTSASLSGHFPELKKGDYLMFENSNNHEIVCLDEDPVMFETSLDDPKRNLNKINKALISDDSKDLLSHAESIIRHITKISWIENDSLKNNYDIDSTIFGNVLKVTQGQTIEKQEILKSSTDPSQIRYRLKQNPIAFVSDSLRPYQSKSTVQVWIDAKPWKKVDSLLKMSSYDECYSVSIDDEDFGIVTFGDGTNGKKPFPWSKIRTSYRIGLGSQGNVGTKVLSEFDSKKFSFIKEVINLIPAKGGVDKQSLDDGKIMGPKTLKLQERAVTSEDYTKLIKQRFPKVSNVKTRFSHNGGWKTLEIILDMKNNLVPNKKFLNELKIFVNKIKMIGYDVSISQTKYIFPEIEISIFLKKGFVKSEAKSRLKFVLGNKEDETGHKGFFHPENFTFGDPIYVSKLYDIIESVHIVDYAIITKFNNFNTPYISTDYEKDEITKRNLKRGFIPVNERNIVRLDNDPNYPEHGSLTLNIIEQRSNDSNV
jgi:hypothetical protein